MDYRTLAKDVVDKVGGEENIQSATRLRLKLRDEDKADQAAVERLPGVITVMQAGGQYQVVIGNNVPTVYAELDKITKVAGEDAPVGGGGGNLFNRFIDLITHLRYFFGRAHTGRQLTERTSGLGSAIRAAYPEAIADANELQAVLQLRLGVPLTEDGVTYLAPHVARMLDEARV